MKKNCFVIVHGSINVPRKERDGFRKGDAIWGRNATPRIVSKHYSLSEAIKALKKYECTNTERGVRGVDVEEYAIVVCNINEDGVWFDKTNYELANKGWNKGGSVVVYEKYVLDGEYKTREEINVAIRNQTHMPVDYFSNPINLELWVEHRDGKTIVLGERWLD